MGGFDPFEGLPFCTSLTYHPCWPDWSPVRTPRANPLLSMTFSLSCALSVNSHGVVQLNWQAKVEGQIPISGN